MAFLKAPNNFIRDVLFKIQTILLKMIYKTKSFKEIPIFVLSICSGEICSIKNLNPGTCIGLYLYIVLQVIEHLFVIY